jgi:hypothetical protein
LATVIIDDSSIGCFVLELAFLDSVVSELCEPRASPIRIESRIGKNVTSIDDDERWLTSKIANHDRCRHPSPIPAVAVVVIAAPTIIFTAAWRIAVISGWKNDVFGNAGAVGDFDDDNRGLFDTFGWNDDDGRVCGNDDDLEQEDEPTAAR